MWHEELLAPSASSSVPSNGEDSFTYVRTNTYSFTDPSPTQVGSNVMVIQYTNSVNGVSLPT